MRCGVEAAPLRAEPRDDAEQVTQALRGDLLEVGEERDGWLAVTTAYGYPGWIRQEHLCGDDPLSLARTFLGSPYEGCGLSAAGIDCSGLVHIAYRLAGRQVPRDSWQQEEAGIPGGERRGTTWWTSSPTVRKERITSVSYSLKRVLFCMRQPVRPWRRRGGGTSRAIRSALLRRSAVTRMGYRQGGKGMGRPCRYRPRWTLLSATRS